MTPTALRHRPIQYNNIDGVGELGIGFFLASWALFGWLQAHASRGSVWNRSFTSFLFFVAVIAIVDRGSKAIKKHITYPRTGFVEYRRSLHVWSAVAAAVVAPIIAVGIAMTIRRHWDISWIAAAIGLIMAAGYAWRIAPPAPWKLAVAAAMAIGSVLLIGKADALQVMAGLLGTLLLISGAITFVLYLKRTSPPAQDAE